MTKPKQIVMHCPCGRAKVLAKGLCSTCYTLKRQDEVYYGGRREEVLKRDDYRCSVPECTTVKRGKRSVAVHHREPGNSDPTKMLTLCLSCHAKVTRTFHLQDDWPEFLRVLWREQHPDGHEQSALNFRISAPQPTKVPLFEDLACVKVKVTKPLRATTGFSREASSGAS